MYTVIKHFVDLQDGNYSYEAGDTFPREGLNVSEERIAELSGSENLQKTPLIQPKKAPAKRTKKTTEPTEE